jgi:hypothetical protein
LNGRSFSRRTMVAIMRAYCLAMAALRGTVSSKSATTLNSSGKSVS